MTNKPELLKLQEAIGEIDFLFQDGAFYRSVEDCNLLANLTQTLERLNEWNTEENIPF
jgi:hypothetical protein